MSNDQSYAANPAQWTANFEEKIELDIIKILQQLGIGQERWPADLLSRVTHKTFG